MLLSPKEIRNKKILIAPLDWGLGHTARCIPLIKQLQQQNNTISIACTNGQKDFLEKEVENVSYKNLFGYKVNYSKQLPLWLKIAWQIPRLSVVVRKEHLWLKKYLQQNKIDVVISDNRFGFYSEEVESIFITHQLNIQTPALNKLVNTLNFSFLQKYNTIWVPDFAEKEKRLSGTLSDTQLKSIVFIGPLSRFEKAVEQEKKYDVLILLSGPEPQRTLLEEKLIFLYKSSPLKIAVVRGTSINSKNSFSTNFEAIGIASTKQLQELFNSSKKIICRSGYSSLMDLHAVDKKALLIPTPGQSEQEYLAQYWKEKFGFETTEQKNI